MELDDLYEQILDQAVSQVSVTAERIAAEKVAVPNSLTELLLLPPAHRAKAVATEARFQTYSLALLLLERSEGAIGRHPGLALELTRLARTVAAQVNPQTCGGPVALADLTAYALAKEGNALRVCGDLPAALGAFARSREIQTRGGGADHHLTALIDLLESSLRRDIGHLPRALNLLDRAEEGLTLVGEQDRLILVQINRSNVFQVQGSFERAGTILEEACLKTTRAYETLVIRHNMAHLLAQSGRPCEASSVLDETRKLYRLFADPLLTSRRQWVEGLVACGLGEQRLARNLLDKAGHDLTEHGFAFDAALVRLDLGRLRPRIEPIC